MDHIALKVKGSILIPIRCCGLVGISSKNDIKLIAENNGQSVGFTALSPIVESPDKSHSILANVIFGNFQTVF